MVEAGGAVVCKRFVGPDPEFARRAASAEFDRLDRFSTALVDVEGVTCPRPVELVSGPDPVLRMRRLPGTPVLSLLRSGPLPVAVHRQVAMAAADGVVTYVQALGEPYYDFQFDNMLYDSASATLVLVDFGLPDQATTVVGLSPMEISLGNLIGSTMFQSARPKWLLQRRQHRQAGALVADVVRRVFATVPAEVSVVNLQRAAQVAYRRCAFRSGWSRSTWYGTAGYVLARRLRVIDVTFRPAGPEATSRLRKGLSGGERP